MLLHLAAARELVNSRVWCVPGQERMQNTQGLKFSQIPQWRAQLKFFYVNIDHHHADGRFFICLAFRFSVLMPEKKLIPSKEQAHNSIGQRKLHQDMEWRRQQKRMNKFELPSKLYLHANFSSV
jgi:hypothetical protein